MAQEQESPENTDLPISIQNKINRDGTVNGILETVLDPQGGLIPTAMAVGGAIYLVNDALHGTLTRQTIIESSVAMLLGGGFTYGLYLANKDDTIQEESSVYQAELPRMNEQASGWNDLNGTYKISTVAAGVLGGMMTTYIAGFRVHGAAEQFREGLGLWATAGTALLGGLASFKLGETMVLHQTNTKRQELRDAFASEQRAPLPNIAELQNEGRVKNELQQVIQF